MTTTNTDCFVDDVCPLGINIKSWISCQPFLQVSQCRCLNSSDTLASVTINYCNVLIASQLIKSQFRWIHTRSPSISWFQCCSHYLQCIQRPICCSHQKLKQSKPCLTSLIFARLKWVQTSYSKGHITENFWDCRARFTQWQQLTSLNCGLVITQYAVTSYEKKEFWKSANNCRS